MFHARIKAVSFHVCRPLEDYSMHAIIYRALTLLQVVKHVNRLRDMSPLWEMHLEGIDMSKVEWSQH